MIWRSLDVSERRHMSDTAFDPLNRDELLRYSQAVCDGLRDDDDGLRREILAHAGSRWSLGVVHTLGVYGQLRHADIVRRMHGVTQRMLTRTLRLLERDGLVIRHDFEEAPPRVEYRLSEAGFELLARMVPLWTWIVENAESFRRARQGFDERQEEASAGRTSEQT